MPKATSLGWVNIQGASTPIVSHNAATISVTTKIPEAHYSFLYGPVSVGDGIEFIVVTDAQVKIKDFADA